MSMTAKATLLVVGALMPVAAAAQAVPKSAPGDVPATASAYLAPLSSEEIRRASAAVKADRRAGRNPAFTFISLHEPDKQALLGGAKPPRVAEVGIYDRGRNRVYEVLVEPASGRIVDWKHVAGAQPVYLDEDEPILASFLEGHPQWTAALKRRGITPDMEVDLNGMSLGDEAPPGKKGDRLMFVFGRIKSGPHGAGGVISGLAAYVNLTERKVLKVVDQGGPIPKDDLTFEPNADKLTPKARLWREAETTSATVDGNSVEWGPWSFSFGMHPREGLVLHLVKLRDKDNRARTVLHRASLSEMAVPYGDPEEGWHGRTVFDAGETGMGKYGRTSLSPGVEAPLNARFFNAVVNDEKGDAVDVPRAIALFERTSGTLWRHRGHGVPAHELVLMSYATIDNYDYGIQWIFREDGVLRVDMELTGIMGVKASEVGNAVLHAGHATGTQVSHHSMAPNHQHFFNFRLDFDVDGPASNSVARVEGGGLPIGPENPHGNLIMTKTTTFETEKDAQDIVSIEGSRKWKILSNSAQPVHGKTPGWLLIPGENALPFAAPGSALRRRAPFTTKHVWVTPYKAEERYAAGEFPFNGDGSDGLGEWTKKNRNVKNTDVVVWYTAGITHLPRPEEWPVMPVHRASFSIAPAGFYARNPVLSATDGLGNPK